jgi:hypothetical protein
MSKGVAAILISLMIGIVVLILAVKYTMTGIKSESCKTTISDKITSLIDDACSIGTDETTTDLLDLMDCVSTVSFDSTTNELTYICAIDNDDVKIPTSCSNASRSAGEKVYFNFTNFGGDLNSDKETKYYLTITTKYVFLAKCQGIVTPCNEIFIIGDDSVCTDQEGCYVITNSVCTGLTKSCFEYNSVVDKPEDACNKQKGCEWATWAK